MWGPVLPQWLGELLGEGNEGAMVAGREAAGWCPRIVLLCSCRHQESSGDQSGECAQGRMPERSELGGEDWLERELRETSELPT